MQSEKVSIKKSIKKNEHYFQTLERKTKISKTLSAYYLADAISPTQSTEQTSLYSSNEYFSVKIAENPMRQILWLDDNKINISCNKGAI